MPGNCYSIRLVLRYMSKKARLTRQQLEKIVNPGLSKEEMKAAKQRERERRRRKKAKKKASKKDEQEQNVAAASSVELD